MYHGSKITYRLVQRRFSRALFEKFVPFCAAARLDLLFGSRTRAWNLLLDGGAATPRMPCYTCLFLCPPRRRDCGLCACRLLRAIACASHHTPSCAACLVLHACLR